MVTGFPLVIILIQELRNTSANTMSNISYREATDQDVSMLGKIRGLNSGTEEHWQNRISGYLAYTVNPQKSLRPRVIYVASEDNLIVGFIAGHLTYRYACDGELQWIDVIKEYQNAGIASELVKLLARWFIDRNCLKICVDPGNDIARHFYEKNGAELLNDHWMIWKDIRTVFQ